MVRLFAFGMLVLCSSSIGFAQNLESLNDSASYVVGLNFALTQLKPQLDQAESMGIVFNNEAMLQAMRDVLMGGESSIGEEEGQQILVRWQQYLGAQLVQKNNQAAMEFLTANQKNPGVKVTATGLQYLVEKEGSGVSPTANDSVVVRYKGMLLDGTVFDQTTDDETRTFYASGLIPGWTEALKMMKPGAKWKLFIPSNLAYGQQGNYGIPPAAALIFEIELVGVKKP